MSASTRGEIDPLVPVFFLSYARRSSSVSISPHDSDELVVRLFHDLVEHLSILIPRRAGEEHGFMDRSIESGDEWHERLYDVLGKCRVFVALTSAPYYQSQWCGWEWSYFSRRRVVPDPEAKARRSTAIVPVRWAPVLNHWEPSAVHRVQLFTPGAEYEEAAYHEHGIYGLLTMNRLEAYRSVVWRLAQHIANVFYSCSVEQADPDWDQELNAFTEGP